MTLWEKTWLFLKLVLVQIVWCSGWCISCWASEQNYG